MSWFDPVHAGQAPIGNKVSMLSTIPRSDTASNEDEMKGKLNASWSSSVPLP